MFTLGQNTQSGAGLCIANLLLVFVVRISAPEKDAVIDETHTPKRLSQ